MLIGIDIGGTKTRVATAKVPNQLLKVREFTTPQDESTFLNDLFQALNSIADLARIDAVGIASPGSIDRKQGSILQPRNLAWHNFQIIDRLKTKLACPIILEHDATCGGIAEARYGNGKNLSLFVYVTISTGIGTSIILDKKPLPTPNNSEGGHMIIDLQFKADKTQTVSFEALASGSAIYHQYGKIAHDINDQLAWKNIARNISFGIFNIMTLIDPEAIILAGGVTANHAKFIDLLKQSIFNIPHIYKPCDIIIAKHTQTAPLIGALYLASQSLHKNNHT